LKQIGIKVYKN